MRRIRAIATALLVASISVTGCARSQPDQSPVDRRKQGLKRSVATDAHGVPLAALPASGLRAAR